MKAGLFSDGETLCTATKGDGPALVPITWRFWLLQDQRPTHSGHRFLFKNRYKCVMKMTCHLELPGPGPPLPERTMWSVAQGAAVLAVIPSLQEQYLIEITAT